MHQWGGAVVCMGHVPNRGAKLLDSQHDVLRRLATTQAVGAHNSCLMRGTPAASKLNQMASMAAPVYTTWQGWVWI